MSNNLYGYYQTDSCTTPAPWILLSQLCIGNPCQYNVAAYNMNLHHSFLLTEKSLWGDTTDFLCSYGKGPLAQELLHQKLPCSSVCKLHPASKAWILSPLIFQLRAHLISLPITSSLKLGSLEEASVSNLKGGFPGLLRVSCLLKRKKPSKSSPSHRPSEVSPGNYPSDRDCSQ